MATNDKVDVLLIGGLGRSGSTILLRVLGSLDGYFPIGELNNSWEHNFVENRLCGCGVSFRECDFWVEVMDEAFGGIDAVDVEHLLELRKATHYGKQSLLYHVLPMLQTESFRRDRREYASAMEAIYRAIKKVSGCKVIVDSSKSPRYAATVTQMPGVRARMIHLVRDSRAVAHSWTRKKKVTDVVTSERFSPTRGHRGIALHWSLEEALVPFASRRCDISTHCRYEDFASTPRTTVAGLLRSLGLGSEPMTEFVSERQVRLGDDHSLGGNPSRFDQGVIDIRPDVEWRDKMPRSTQLQVTLLTLPGLLKYGYLRGGDSTAAEGLPARAAHDIH